MFRCEICGKKYKIINGYHLKKHGISVNEYRKLFPTSEMGFSKRKHQIKNTCLEKYGTDNISKVDKIKQKKKETCLENFGVDVPAKSETVKNKMKETCLENFGVDVPAKSETVKNKMKETFIENYGVDNPLKCDTIKTKMTNTMIKNWGSKTYKESKEHLNNYIIQHSFLFTVEDYRILDGKIQVHCKNHNCPNSKEQGGWFTPTSSQLNERRRCIEHQGVDHSYFYCCNKCKESCPLYKSRGVDPFKDESLLYNKEEIQTWRVKVKELDNSKCQICETTENIHVHHIIPKKLEPFFALDPDNGICLCQECHFKHGHSNDGCKTVDLANKQCRK